MEELASLSEMARTVIEEEQALLARVLEALRGALAATGTRPGPEAEVETMQALRDETRCARPEDLPGVLLEMAVRHRLLGRQGSQLPDPLAPYLAHLRLEEDGRVRDYLLGHATFIDRAAGIHVIDWRSAALAKIFYRYREGEEYEEQLPGRLAEGVVLARRIVTIERGELVGIVGDGISLRRRLTGGWVGGDAAALALAGGGAGTATRPGALGVGVGAVQRARTTDVTALLDQEQYAAIAAPPEQPLLVLGSAGSGKTTVALHRLARLAADGAHALDEMQVVVPEKGLARLSRRLLEPLGAGEAQISTLDAFFVERGQALFGRKLKLCFDPPALTSSFKRHPALFRALRDQGRTLGKRPSLQRMRAFLADRFTDRGFLAAVVDAAGGDLPRTAIEETVRHTLLQLAAPAEREAESITDESRKIALDGAAYWEGTPEELGGTVDLEDLPLLLCLRAWAGSLEAAPISHLVLDEAEDFSLFELHVLGRSIEQSRGATLAGDEAQQTASSFAGWRESLEVLGVGDASVCRLSTSYRCPRPVTELARHLLGSMAPAKETRAAREGAPVGRFTFADQAQAQLFVAGALRDLLDREPGASVAVITNEAEAARRFFPFVADRPDARLVLDGGFSFEPGIDVTDVDEAKGLEWDYVVVLDASARTFPATFDARRRLHVAVTRTTHQLWLVSGGAPSPLLPA
ncbi:ATP-binding domain-containing protein [Vulgatibacter sp.]|uniref:ATP-binding domain-containing protein n=1 Tax=Vulgatibacter sp. TaxID=1971226 RepID=UPI003561F953